VQWRIASCCHCPVATSSSPQVYSSGTLTSLHHLTLKLTIPIRTRHRGILVLDRDECSASRPDRFNRGYPLNDVLVGPRPSLTLLERRKVACSFREPKPDPPARVLFSYFSEFLLLV
jgi:hypothetical protein